MGASMDGGPRSHGAVTLREGSPWVERTSLLARLGESDARFCVIQAPAGSGKSTLLCQWAAQEARPVAWVAVTPAHGDPALLVGDIAEAIAAQNPDGEVARIRGRLRSTDPSRTRMRLSKAIGAESRPMLLILDDVHLLGDHQPALELLALLVDQLPAGWTAAVALRAVTRLPLARWRIGGSYLGLDYDDLVMSTQEIRLLLTALGVTASDAFAGEVRERTEGWPAGVYLAALAIRSERPLRSGTLVAGDDALVRAYLDSEVLADIDPDDRELLVRVSILDQVSGPVADALTGDIGAAERLRRVAQQNVLVAAVDREERWYRCHSLLRERLLRELDDRGPALRRSLHRRASAWFRDEGRIADAVVHAFDAHDAAAARQLVITHSQAQYRLGRSVTIWGWLRRFTDDDLRREPSLALTAAHFAAVEGQPVDASRWAALADLEVRHGPDDEDGGPDRPTLRAYLCQTGPSDMLADGMLALAGHAPSWRWRPTVLLSLGAAHLMLDDAAAAESVWEEMERDASTAEAVARIPARVERAWLSMARRRWSDAELLLGLDRQFLLEQPDHARLSGLGWLIADARMALHRGDVRRARERLRQVQHNRPLLTWAIPWYAVRTLTELATTQLLAGDPAGARASIAQAAGVVKVRPRLGTLVAGLDEVAERARQAPNARSEASSLSPAELRLLPLLPTYLSFKEIGERLGISGNTVKTEAMSIYAKIGATSRSEAVEKAVAGGLLDDPFA